MERAASTIAARPKMTPKDFFLYLGALTTLYWSAGSLIALLFAIIDTVFRDELSGYVDPYSGGIRFAIASLVVVFPISLVLFTAIKRDVLRDPQKFLLPLRRWLYAITVFVTAATLVGDFIALLNQFLGGELTARFLLKAVSVLVTAGFILWYCLLEIRVRPESPARIRREFLLAAVLIVLASIVYGFVVMGSPVTIRKLRFDERRVGDLQGIQWQIVNYWREKEEFPESLAALEDSISGYRVPIDPTVGRAYRYEHGSGYTFKLCATFDLPGRDRSGERPPVPHPVSASQDNWAHDAGSVCFTRILDPERYPPNEKVKRQ